MKGIIFTTLGDMVEERFGLETWNQLLNTVNPPNGGAYTAGGTYPDAEIFSLITVLSNLVDVEPLQLVEAFGIYMFPVLAKKHSNFLQKGLSLKDFLKSIDRVIHVEVRKLHADASLPSITYEDPAPNQLVMLYRSPRKLCALAIGLIKGAAIHFKNKVTIQQPCCMHQGADHCRLEVHIEH